MATSRYEAGARNRTGPDDASGPDASPKGVSRKRAVRHRVAAAAPRPGNGARPPAEAGSLPDVVELACRFARERGRPVLTYLLGAGDPAEDRPDVPITARTVEQVERALGDESFDDLDLVIHSSGGDVHAAYQMMCLLRGRMTGKGQLVAWVPRKALSSATLLCLGADEIRLGELGALGPLDAQIRRGTTDLGTPDYVSALHLLKSLNRLQQFALETFTETAAVLYDHQIGNEDVLRFGVEFSRAITAPLFARIDSEKAGFWDQMLQTGEFYGCRLLEKGRLVRPGDADTPREEQIKRIVHQVVFGFPSHELRLRADELSGPELQLNAFLVPAEQPRLRGLARGLSAASAQTLIALVRPLDGSLDDPLDGDVPGERARQPLPRTDWRTIGADDTGARARLGAARRAGVRAARRAVPAEGHAAEPLAAPGDAPRRRRPGDPVRGDRPPVTGARHRMRHRMAQFPQQLPRAAVVAAWALLLLMGAALLALSGFLVVQQLRGGALTPAQTKDLWPFLGTVLGVVATLIGVLVADQQKRRTDAVTRESANRQELETIAKVLELIDVQDPHTRRARVSGAVATMMELQGGTVGIRLLRELWQADAIDPDTAVWFIDREFRACLDPRERNRQGKSPADAEADAVAAADALAVNAHKLVPTSGDCDQLNACWPEQLAQWRPELPLAARRHVVFACLRMILARSPRWWRGVGQAKPLTTLLGALDDPDLGPRVADALCALLDLGVAAAIMPDLPAATVAGIRARAAGRPLSAPMRYLIDQFAVWVDGRPPDIFGRRLREDHWSEAILGAGDSGGRRSSTKGESEDAVLLPGVVEPGEPLRRGGRVPAGAPDREAGPGAPHGPRGLDRGRP